MESFAVTTGHALVARADVLDVGFGVAGRAESLHDADLLPPVVDVSQLDGYARLERDVLEAPLPFVHAFACAFGRDG